MTDRQTHPPFKVWTRTEFAVLFWTALFVVMLVFGTFAFFPGVAVSANDATEYLVNCKGRIEQTYPAIWWLLVIQAWLFKGALLGLVAAAFGGLLARRHWREWYDHRPDFAWYVHPLIRIAPFIFGSMLLLGFGLYFAKPGWWLVH